MSNFMSIHIAKILDQFLRIKAFRNYIDFRANHIYFGNGYADNPDNGTINEVYTEYKFYDIQPTDIVLDIGANIGAFTMFMARNARHVYAVEPMTTNTLRTNIENNKLKNITVLNECLGDGETVISWRNVERTINAKSLSEIISLCGGHIDFLKCDCEGGEWCIHPEELQNIRRIEIEVHNFNDAYDFNVYLKMIADAGFDYTYKIQKKTDMLVHAVRRK